MVVAERELSGYPETIVKLECNFEDDTHSVMIYDGCGEFVVVRATDRQHAKDAYFHPFAFGYETPEGRGYDEES